MIIQFLHSHVVKKMKENMSDDFSMISCAGTWKKGSVENLPNKNYWCLMT